MRLCSFFVCSVLLTSCVPIAEPAPASPVVDTSPAPRARSTTSAHEDRIAYIPNDQIAELAPRFDKLTSLGVKTLFLADLTGKGKRVADPSRPVGELSERALASLVTDAREAGFDVVVDLELNHVEATSRWVDDEPSWFHDYGPIRRFSDRGELIFFDVEGTRDFAQENPQVRAFLIGTAVSFIDRAPISGLAFKNVRHAPAPFWAEVVWASLDSAASHFRTIGQYLSEDPKQLSLEWRLGGFGEMLDYPLHAGLLDTLCGDAPPERLASILSSDYRYSNPRSLITWVDGPETNRPINMCTDAEQQVALTIQHGIRGVPMIRDGPSGCREVACENERRELLRELYGLRERHPVLFRGASRLIAAGRAGILLLRFDREEVAAVLYNARREEPLSVPLPLGVTESSAIEFFAAKVANGQMSVAPGSAGIAIFRRLGRDSLEWSQPTARAISLRITDLPHDIQTLRIVGSDEALGDWERESALSFERVDDAFVATWTLPRGRAVEYRLLTTNDIGEVFESGSRYFFVDYQRGALSLSSSW